MFQQVCGEPLHRLGVGPYRLGGLALGGQAQPERADLNLECPGVQLLGLPGTRSRCGHGRGSLSCGASSAAQRFRRRKISKHHQDREMPRGTAPAAETGQPRRAPGTPLATSRPTADGGQRTPLGAQPLRAEAPAPRAEQPYDAAAFIDCAALHRTDRTFCRPSAPASVLDFRRPAGRFTAHG